MTCESLPGAFSHAFIKWIPHLPKVLSALRKLGTEVRQDALPDLLLLLLLLLQLPAQPGAL